MELPSDQVPLIPQACVKASEMLKQESLDTNYRDTKWMVMTGHELKQLVISCKSDVWGESGGSTDSSPQTQNNQQIHIHHTSLTRALSRNQTLRLNQQQTL